MIQVATLIVLILYLLAFFGGTVLAARAAGRPVWLFGQARGRDRLAAAGFRIGFALALVGPVVMAVFPALTALDPLCWPLPDWAALPGLTVAVAGAMLAFAAQMAMGASWRVGVTEEGVGDLVDGGLYALSRNPTFVGQAGLLIGVALAIPSLPTLLGAVLFVASAQMQIRSEEAALHLKHGAAFEAFRARTPRWIGCPSAAG